MPANLPTSRLRFRIRLADESVDVRIDGDSIEVNGRVRVFDAEPLGESLWSFLIDGRSIVAHVEPLEGGQMRLTFAGRTLEITVQDERDLLLERTSNLQSPHARSKDILAPMPGLVLAVLVQPGHRVEVGDALLVIEAMKMENEIRSPIAAVVRAVHVSPGEAVGKNSLLMELANPDTPD